MQKRFFILLTILACTAFCSIADVPYDAWWQKANQLYQHKEYDSAASYYEKISALHPQDARVYYNLGNTYYRLNKIGPAILNYERALHINPEYKEAKDNLVLTQSRIGNHIQSNSDIFFVKWWKFLTSAERSGTWAISSLLVFLLIILLLLARRFRRDTIKIPTQLIGLMWLVWAGLMVLSFTAADNKANSSKAVVMQNDAPLMSAQKGKTQSLVPEGTTVELKDQNGDWAEIILPDGRNGWMQLSLLNKI